jgi:hypothetical protein
MFSAQYADDIVVLFPQVTKYNQRVGHLIQGNTFMQGFIIRGYINNN